MTKTESTNADMTQKPQNKAIPRRRSGRAKLVGQSVQRITKPFFKEHGFTRDDVIYRWREIVGPELARFSYPTKIVRGRDIQETALVVRVAGAAAPEFEHMAPQVIERINTYYGHRAIARLKIEQGPLPVPLPRQKEKSLPPLTDSEQKELKASLSTIDDDDLRGQLERLGELVKRSQKR